MKVEVKGSMNVIIASDITIKGIIFSQTLKIEHNESIADKVFDTQYGYAREMYNKGEVEITIDSIELVKPLMEKKLIKQEVDY
jgi:hypothetical protein